MAQTYQGPILVTVVYVLVYYALIIHVLRTKTRVGRAYRERGEHFDRYLGNDREMLAADRGQLNMLEQMPVFLCLLWLHVVIVDVRSGTIAGAIYTLSRALYPFVFPKSIGANTPFIITPITFTGYGVIAYFAVTLAIAALR